MAIKKSDQSTDTKWVFEFDNGDLEAIKDALAKFRFVSEEALFRYALFAMLQSDNNRLYVKKNNDILAVKPSEELVEQDKSGEVS